MKNIIIACDTLKYEILVAKDKTNNSDEIIWLDGMLHMDTDRLRTELQKEIDIDRGCDHILLAYGNCGNALVGLNCSHAKMVVPKTADCISMLLNKKEDEISRDTYFLTRGWIELEKNIVREYSHCQEKYGDEKTKQIFKVMLNNYRNLMLIDSGAYDLNDYTALSKEIAKKINLNFSIKKGETTMLEKLFANDWGNDFAIIEKDKQITMADFELDNVSIINCVSNLM
ncbi:DUF1638 domain-containing protein [Alkalibacter mobilis]|uniref:DUF1638 domain-containing protein n=1 Tax=Alkalibacter mobilis TaxID=2787712 RepID=UPI00189D6E0D|nr:DUF1638 domain-containing protein [Alkalibacter mobilis]MBF7096543.1 DUF1638 domain-containing protein [Alkalibacter mobilis]